MPEFTAEQLDAAQYKHLDACVVAGPGSGKTTVLVERYRKLIVDEGFTTRDILAITFTEKAAANMKAKLIEAFRDKEDFRREMEQAWVSTIHGFCARLLHENAIAAGVDPRFKMLDARESEQMQYECINEALDELTIHRREETIAMIGALPTPAMTYTLRDAWDAMRCAGMTVAQARAIASPFTAPSIFEAARQLQELQSRFPSFRKNNQIAQYDDIANWIGDVAATPPHEIDKLARLALALKIDLRYVPRPVEDWREIRDNLMPAVRAGLIDETTTRFRAMIFDALSRFEEIYAERKTTAATLDFNDLERFAIRLLRENHEVKDRVRKQFRQVMLDEFQDINEQQQTLIREIRGENAFFAVGDTNQSIYGFRHAEPAIFENYRAEVREQNKHSAQLLHNFRSRPQILEFVEKLLNDSDGIDKRDLKARSEFCAKNQPSIEIIRAIAEEDGDSDDASDREGKWIAHTIHRLRNTLRITGKDGQPQTPEFRDFAVLCRSRDGMTPILKAFIDASIPHVCGRRQSFLEAREGLDIVALLSTVANPRDSVALAAVLRSPLIGVSDEGLLRLRGDVSSITSGLNQIAFDNTRLESFDPDDARKIAQFTASLRRWRTEQPVIPLDLLIVRMLNDCGVTWLPKTREGDDIEAFLTLARQRGPQQSLFEFLREVESMKKNQNNESDLSDEDQGNRVQVMTAHGAKGLEYAVTIVAAMSKGVQRTTDPINFSPLHGLGIKWGKLGKDGAYDSWGTANKARIEAREKEETNRLLYVAMTRAKEHLVLAYAYANKQRGEWSKKIDDFFNLKELEPSDHPRLVTGNKVEASARITDKDPPPVFFDMQENEGQSYQQIVPFIAHHQPDTAINVTALNLFAHCPRKYYIQRYVGWRGPQHANTAASDLGTEVHDLLANKPGDYSPEARRLAEVAKPVASVQREEREWEFITETGGMLVTGSIDMWFEKDNEIHIVDYKTDSSSDRASYYAPQLSLYAMALEKALGRKPKSASLHFLKKNEVHEIEIQDATELIRTVQKAQQELTFDVNPGPHCHSCEYFKTNCLGEHDPGQ